MTWEPKIKIVDGETHRNYLREAYVYAWNNSDDTITKTGAVLVRPDLAHIIACGTNHFPVGLNPTLEEKEDREWKYKHIIHAETAAIFSAAKSGRKTQDTIMYMPWIPCTECAKAIIDAGISALVGHEELIMKTPERWRDSTDYALELLEKCGVERYMYFGKIDGVENLFDGEIWEP